MSLGQRIAQEVETAFNSLGPKGKPTTRSNGTKEWTVLAGLVAVEEQSTELTTKASTDTETIEVTGPTEFNKSNNSIELAGSTELTESESQLGFRVKDESTVPTPTKDSPKLSVLVLATGVKAMPDEVRAYSDGRIVHDMHAEMLCLRMFNWLLMEEVSGRSSCVLEPTGTGFRVKPSIKLALYISEPPCGDASMSLVSDKKEAWEHEPKRQKVLRGRAHFDRLGQVRTKPGRADSKVTYSKSCSDKLCVKQLTGVLNCLTSLCVEPVYLEYLVLPEEKFNSDDFSRCFQRISSSHPLKALTFSHSEYEFGKKSDTVPSQLSLIHCPVAEETQVLNNGVKDGAYIKNKPPRPPGSSILCKRRLWEQARDRIGPFEDYLSVKRSNTKRQQLKEKAREILGSWPATTAENFA